MTDEKTPLVDEETIQKVKENLAEAQDVVTKKIQEYVETAKKGNTSIRGLALVAGVSLLFTSVYEILLNALQFQFSSALIAVYSLVMGSIAIAMEMDPEALPYGEKIRAWLTKYIALVQLATGRGLFYLVSGSLALIQDEYFSKVVGMFTCFVAVLYIVAGQRATTLVKELRQERYPTWVVRRKFNEFDSDGDGYITFQEFHNLITSLGVDVSYQGSEMLFVSLDRDMNGNLEFEEFQQFWSSDPLTLIAV